MARLSELRSKVTGRRISVAPLDKKKSGFQDESQALTERAKLLRADRPAAPVKEVSAAEQARIEAGQMREEMANQRTYHDMVSRQKTKTPKTPSFFADTPTSGDQTFFDIDPSSIYEAQEYRAQEQERLDREWQKERNKAKLYAGSIIQTADAAPGVLTETTKQGISNIKRTWDAPGYAAAVSALDQAQKELDRVTLELTEEARARFPDIPDSALAFYADKDDQRYQAALQAVNGAKSTVDALTVNEPVDPNSYAMKQYAKAKDTGERFLEGLEGPGRFWGEVGLSIGQDLATLPAAAIAPSAPLAVSGAMAAADKMYELDQRGVGAGEAWARGALSGGIEAAIDKIPMENVLKLQKNGRLDSFVKDILERSGIGATEGSVSYLANYLADKAFQDPNASFSVEELLYNALSGGMSGLGDYALGTLDSLEPLAQEMAREQILAASRTGKERAAKNAGTRWPR